MPDKAYIATYIVSKHYFFRGPINYRISHGIDNKLNEIKHSTDPRFSPTIYGAQKSKGKNLVRNLRCGPQTRLVRGMYFFFFHTELMKLEKEKYKGHQCLTRLK